MNLEKIVKNSSKILYKRYKNILNFDLEDYEQECRIAILKIPRNKYSEKYLYRCCYNHIITQVRKLNGLSFNNKSYKVKEEIVDDQLFFNIKNFIDNLNEEDKDMMQSIIYKGNIAGNVSTRYKRFNELRIKLKEQVQDD